MKNMDRLSVRGKVLTAAAIAFFILSIASPAKRRQHSMANYRRHYSGE